MKTTYRHRFRPELLATVDERRGSNPAGQRRGTRVEKAGVDGEKDDDARWSERAIVGTVSATYSSSPPASLSRHHVPGTDARASEANALSPKTLPNSICRGASPAPTPAISKSWEIGSDGVTAGEFSEALARCPEMLDAFESQLAARFRHRHRPAWMAPILRKGG